MVVLIALFLLNLLHYPGQHSKGFYLPYSSTIMYVIRNSADTDNPTYLCIAHFCLVLVYPTTRFSPIISSGNELLEHGAGTIFFPQFLMKVLHTFQELV